MPEILLRRHWREDRLTFHTAGSTIDVDEDTADRLVGLGAASLISSPTEETGQGFDDVGQDLGNQDMQEVTVAEDVAEAASDEPRKPLKTDKLAVFQAWARHQGDNPDKPLAELKAKYL